MGPDSGIPPVTTPTVFEQCQRFIKLLSSDTITSKAATQEQACGSKSGGRSLYPRYHCPHLVSPFISIPSSFIIGHELQNMHAHTHTHTSMLCPAFMGNAFYILVIIDQLSFPYLVAPHTNEPITSQQL